MNPVTWRTSSYSGHDNNCVEVARNAEYAAIRDTKARAAGHLTLTSRAFAAFLADARSAVSAR